MTVEQLASSLGFTPLALPDKDREVVGAYVGDLLSWVMGRAASDSVWVTIMSNVNVIAVATLVDVACIVFAEGVTPDEELVKLATSKGVNLLVSNSPAYETALLLSELV